MINTRSTYSTFTSLVIATAIVAGLSLCFSTAMAKDKTADDATQVIRRYALLAGSNDGGSDRIKLRYATTDAESFADVLQELGGLEEKSKLVLTDPSRMDMLEAFEQLGEILRKDAKRSTTQAATGSAARQEVMFYYSGHSDEKGLRLGNDLLSFEDLRSLIKELPADVKIAVLDSCSSGSLTRLKGGKMRPPFMVDGSQAVSGHAYLTSSSANEAAQESDTIGASFFTHYLVSGMRGAADTSGDSRVTLSEAYKFAFDETLARTQSTRNGPQHPNYDIHLAGSGDLVMTDISKTTALLVLAEELGGRVFIRNGDKQLVAELGKISGRRIELALAPGAYDVTLDSGDANSTLRADGIILRQGERRVLSLRDLHSLQKEQFAARGNEKPRDALFDEMERMEKPRESAQPDAPKQPQAPSEESVQPLDVRLDAPVQPQQLAASQDSGAVKSKHLDFSFSIFPGLGTPGSFDPNVTKSTSINLFYGRSRRVIGFEMGMFNQTLELMDGLQLGLGNINGGKQHGVSLAALFNLVRFDSQGVMGSGVFNIAGNFNGLLGAGLFNLAGPVSSGVQAAGLFNMISGNSGGNLVQAAGVFNFAREIDGVQAAGVFNLAKKVQGGQFSVVNITHDLDGVQGGIVNIATGKINGRQIGLVNIANEYESGGPIGLLSFTKNGQLFLDLWSSNSARGNVGLRVGGETIYTVLSGSFEPIDGSRNAVVSAGLGLGVTKHLGDSLRIHLDLSAISSGSVLVSDEQIRSMSSTIRQQARLRLFGSLRVFGDVGIIAGVSASGAFDSIFIQAPQRTVGPTLAIEADTRTINVWPGLFAGVQL